MLVPTWDVKKKPSKDNTVLTTDVQQGDVQIFIYLRKPGSIISILIF
jgi:hypothetical protein